jgi:hypothetical protein
LAHGSALDALAAIHQGKKRAQNPRLDFIGHWIPARGDVNEGFSPCRNLLKQFLVPLMRGIAERCLAAHLHALLFDEECEVKKASAFLSERGWHAGLASF